MEKLAQHQIPASELALMSSVAHLGSKSVSVTALSKRPVVNEALKKAMQQVDETDYDFTRKIEEELTSKTGKKRKRTRVISLQHD